ncbi:MAG TPA: glycosyltransferase family 4 protein [Ignavibacteriaceae bacterium]|nr:glycosyltransferase family 4 protein [Ignavibacteriaceae bacterium]
MSSILHISYDLRSRLNRDSTSAVKNLIKETSKFMDTITFDLLRVPNPKEEMVENENNKHIKLNVLGFPFGIFLVRHLNRAYKKIKKIIEENKIDLFDIKVIHAHKLTFEGYIAYKIAKENNIPLFVTLRQTDFTVLKYRPDIVSRYKEIISSSEKLFVLLPIMKIKLKRFFGETFYNKHIKDKLIFLPNIIERPFKDTKNVYDKYSFLTIARMDKRSVKRKNLKRLIEAFSLLGSKKYKLRIIGSGDYLYKVKEWCQKYNVNDRIELIGNVDNEHIDQYYSTSLAFLMPSISESFGMVYAESLINGTPILYSKKVLGFDGVFEKVGAGANPFDTLSIKQSIEDLITNNEFYRKTISELKSKDAFEIFSAKHINKTLADILKNKVEEKDIELFSA